MFERPSKTSTIGFPVLLTLVLFGAVFAYLKFLKDSNTIASLNQKIIDQQLLILKQQHHIDSLQAIAEMNKMTASSFSRDTTLGVSPPVVTAPVAPKVPKTAGVSANINTTTQTAEPIAEGSVGSSKPMVTKTTTPTSSSNNRTITASSPSASNTTTKNRSLEKKLSNSSTSASSTMTLANTNTSKTTAPASISFEVQIGAFKALEAEKYKKTFPNLQIEKSGGLYKCSINNFSSYEKADAFKNKARTMGFDDAFVIARQGGKRIDLATALGICGGTK